MADAAGKAATGEVEENATLPEADFSIDSSDEDEADHVSVFNRSALLHSMGITDHDDPAHPEAVAIATGTPPENATPSCCVFESTVSGCLDETAGGKILGERSKHKEKAFESAAETTVSSSQQAGMEQTTDVDWERFKADFTSTLQCLEVDSLKADSSVHVAQDSTEGESFRHQLLINTILSLHTPALNDTTSSEQDHGSSHESTPGDDVIAGGSRGFPPVAASGGGVSLITAGWSRSSILTVGTLETIHEAELDRVLDSVSPPSVEDLPTRSDSESIPQESGRAPTVTCNEKDGHDSVPIPAAAWNEAIAGAGLIEQLEQLRMGTETFESPADVIPDSEPSSANSGPPVAESTVFVDLRGDDGCHGNSRKEGVVSEPSLAAQRLLSAWKSHDDSSSEEGEATSWLQQRAMFKSTPSHPHHPHHPHHRPPHTLTPSQVATTTTAKPPMQSHDLARGSHEHVASTVQLKSTDKQMRRKDAEKDNQAVDHMTSGVDHMTRVPSHMTTKVDHMILKVSSSSSISEEDILTPAAVGQTSASPPTFLTLSSSFSEDGTSEENLTIDRGAGQMKGIPPTASSSSSLNETPPTSPSKQPPTSGSAGKKKTSSKKSKKKKKSAESSHKHKRRQRTRSSDSLTTSSDEEHSSSSATAQETGTHHPLSRADLIASFSTPPSSPFLPPASLSDAALLREYLKRRIFSRKPPAHFVTPATGPVYHEDASFSPVMAKLNPTLKTSAILALPLSDTCLLQLPDCLADRLDDAATKCLHSLIVTWLVGAVAGDSPWRNGNVENGNIKNGESFSGGSVESCGSEEVFNSQIGFVENGVTENEMTRNGSLEDCDSHSLPFRVSGLQQTILDGNPAILVAIATTQTAPKTSRLDSSRSSDPTPDVFHSNETTTSQVEIFLKNTTLSSVLHKTLATVHPLIPSSVLEQLQPFFSLPLEDFFAVQDDVSPLNSAVSFYWHSLYHPSVLPSEQSLRTQTTVQTTVSTLSPASLADPLIVYATLSEVFQRGLDLVGLRVVFGQDSSHVDTPLPPVALATTGLHGEAQPGPIVAMATEKEAWSGDTIRIASSQSLPILTQPSAAALQCSDSSSSLLSDDATSSSAPLPLLPTLALAIRGPDAVFRWMEAVGPEDPSLARITDPASLSARFGRAKEEEEEEEEGRAVIPKCVRTPYRAQLAVGRWFGGRACLKSGSVLGISDAHTKSERRKRQRVRFSETQSESEDGLPSPVADVCFPPLVFNRATLIAPRYSNVLLVISPHVPPQCYSTVLSACGASGFDIFGVKRLRLNTKRASALQIPPKFTSHFTPSSAPPSPSGLTEFIAHPLLADPGQNSVAPLPSMVLLLGRENALTHSKVLISTAKKSLDDLTQMLTEASHLNAMSEDCLFHATELTDDASKVIGTFSLSPSATSTPVQLDSAWLTEDKLREEIAFVAVTQSSSLDKAVSILEEIFDVPSDSHFPTICSDLHSRSRDFNGEKREKQDFESFELLGFKVIPQLSRFHSKQLCPVPATSPPYQQAVQQLSDVPATILVLRGINCNERLNRLTSDPQRSSHLASSASAVQHNLSCIVSQNLQEGYRLSAIFFSDKELFTDLKSRVLAKSVPYSWLQDSAILSTLTVEPRALLSVFTIDGRRETKFFLKVLERVSRAGFEVVAMATVGPSSNRITDAAKEGVVFESRTESEEEEEKEEGGVAVCVRRENAVWRLGNTLAPLTSSSSSCGRQLTWSATFALAVDDVKKYFPEGICCQPPAISIMTQFEIASLKPDDFTGFAGSKIPKFVDSTGYASPFMETTIVVLPPSLTTRGGVAGRGVVSAAPFVGVLETLVLAGFLLSRVKMAVFSRETSEQLCRMCSATKIKAEELTFDPCLLAVLQRDNAAACFSMVLKSAMQSRLHGNPLANMEELVSKMLVPQNSQEVKKVMQFFSVETEC